MVPPGGRRPSRLRRASGFVLGLSYWAMLAASTIGPGTITLMAKGGADMSADPHYGDACLSWTIAVASVVSSLPAATSHAARGTAELQAPVHLLTRWRRQLLSHADRVHPAGERGPAADSNRDLVRRRHVRALPNPSRPGRA